MLKSGFRSLGLAVAVILFLIVFQICTYTVSETEQIVLTRFGAPIGQPITPAKVNPLMPGLLPVPAKTPIAVTVADREW